MESIYDYGARAGFWRLHRLFTGRGLPVTIFGVASALARSPEQVAAMQGAGWEIASHGLKWVEHRDMPEAEERAAIAEAIRLHTEVTGAAPARLVYRALLHEHRAAGRGNRGVRLDFRQLTTTTCRIGWNSATATS